MYSNFLPYVLNIYLTLILLKVLDSPFREVTRPILDYVKSVRRDSPRDVISIFVPKVNVIQSFTSFELLH